jgi:hypothetical protein
MGCPAWICPATAFRRRIAARQRQLEAAPAPNHAHAGLPPAVSALADRLGVPAEPAGGRVRLVQRGLMWSAPGARPMAFTARQTLLVGAPGFLWQARFPVLGRWLAIEVADSLAGDSAGLEGWLAGLLPVVRSQDTDALVRGEAMRYLAELMWVPDALRFNPALEWREGGESGLEVACGRGARHAAVRLLLDRNGDLAGAEAEDRPRTQGRTATPCPWFGRCSDYREIGGRRIPTRAEAGWRQPDGSLFTYWQGTVEAWELAP